MKPIALLGLISLLLVPACGDSGGGATDSNTSGDTSTTTGTTAPESTGTTAMPTSSGSTGSTGDSAGQTTGPNTTTTDATTTDASTTTDATTGTTEPGTSDSSTGAPIGEPLGIALKDVYVYANCQPIVDPDNIIGFWTVVYDNSKGLEDGAAELTSATLHLSLDKDPSQHEIAVDPTGSGLVPAGKTLEQEQKKQKGAPTPGCGICDTPYRLDLVFSSGGVDVPVSHEDILGCVY
jgi:hypothetical protein